MLCHCIFYLIGRCAGLINSWWLNVHQKIFHAYLGRELVEPLSKLTGVLIRQDSTRLPPEIRGQALLGKFSHIRRQWIALGQLCWLSRFTVGFRDVTKK